MIRILLALVLLATSLQAQNVSVLARPNGDLVTPTNFFKNLVKGTNLKPGTGINITQVGSDYYFSAGDFTALFNTNQFDTNTLITIKSGASLTNLLIYATNTFGDGARLVFGTSGEFYADLKDTGGLPGSGGSVTFKNVNGNSTLELNVNKMAIMTNCYFSNLVASRVLVLDAYNRIVSSDITSAELDTLDNVTGNIQNQLNVLQVTNVNLTGWSNVATNAVLYNILTSKGDIITYSTAPTILSLGTNGQVLITDSTTATGLKWSTLTNLPAVDNYTLTNAVSYIAVDTNNIASRSFVSNFVANPDLSGYALLAGTNTFTGTNTFNNDVYFNSNVWLGSVVSDSLTVIYSIGVASGGTGTNQFAQGYVYSPGGTNALVTTTNIIAVVTNQFQTGSQNLTNWSALDTNILSTIGGGNATNAQPPSANLTNWSQVATSAVVYPSQLGTAAYSNSIVFQTASTNLDAWSTVYTNAYVQKTGDTMTGVLTIDTNLIVNNRIGLGSLGNNPSYALHLRDVWQNYIWMERTGTVTDINYTIGSIISSINDSGANDSLTSVNFLTGTTNRSGVITFGTQPPGGTVTERLRIDENGCAYFWNELRATNVSISTLTQSNNTTYTLSTPTPSSATNFVFDFGKATHYYNMTNHVNFTSSTNRPAEGFEIFTTFTMINRSGSNLNVSFPTNWIALGNPPTVCTNGKSLMISATAIGNSETNVIYGAAN